MALRGGAGGGGAHMQVACLLPLSKELIPPDSLLVLVCLLPSISLFVLLCSLKSESP